MKKRINRGIEESSISYGPMGRAEGSRHNLLPDEPFSSNDCLVKMVGAKFLGPRQHPKFVQAHTPAWIFELTPKVPFQIKLTVECNIDNLGFTFSTFAEISSASVLLKAVIQDCTESKCEYFFVTPKNTRFEVAHEFAESPTKLSVVIEGEISNDEVKKPVELSLAFPIMENGLFSSSPILNGFSDGDQLSVQRDKNFFAGNSGTIFLIFVPKWTGPQLGGQSAYLFDCASKDQNNSVSIFADGDDFGKIKASIVVNGHTKTISTDIIPIRGKMYSVALRWVTGVIEIIVNGRTMVVLDDVYLPCVSKLGDRVYYGSTGRSPYLSSFSGLACLQCYSEWLSDVHLRAISYEAYPAVFTQFQVDWRNIVSAPRLKKITNESYAFPLFSILLGIHRLWQHYPPKWLIQEAIDEADTRDEVLRYLKSKNYSSIPEEHTSEGCTDLLVKIPSTPNSIVRLEFKVWGRNDYKNIPEKPLKYFAEGETIGIVIMINPNKKKSINDEYRENVNNSQTGCSDIVIKPFDSDLHPYHFVSTHNSQNGHYAEILHIVLNRQGPFASKDLLRNNIRVK